MPGPPKDSADASNACMSGLLCAVAWPKKARSVAYACDISAALHNFCCAFLDRVRKVGAAIESVHAMRQRVTSFQIGACCFAHRAARDAPLLRSSLHARERLAHVETEPSVERERAIVKRRLHQADASRAALAGAIQNCAHEFAADTEILHRSIDGDRPEPVNHRALVEAIAADDSASHLRNDAIKSGRREQSREDSDAILRSRQVGREIVCAADRGECVVADFACGRGVVFGGDPDRYGGGLCLGHSGAMVAKSEAGLFARRATSKRFCTLYYKVLDKATGER